jgi:pyruvate formate lyase activating enzyme
MGEALQEARYWEAEAGFAHCRLCPWQCKIRPDKLGRCRARRNDGGTLHTLNYARVTAANLDPIEKKPLYHFHPGSAILSLGTFGCNLTCQFCQNWEISQGEPQTRHMAPATVVGLAKGYVSSGNIGIAYTYSEPMIWHEYVYDTSILVREAGLKNVLVTNGIVEEKPLRDLLPLVDAMNVDIKAMDEGFYRKLCSGEAWVPRRTVEIAHEAGVHVEITNLIIPGYNDSDEELIRLFDWAASVSEKMPVHLSAYHPDYKLEAPPTPAGTLRHAFHLAKERLQFVYVGNTQIDGTTDTTCPQCGKVPVRRRGFGASVSGISGGKCANCGEDLNVTGQ